MTKITEENLLIAGFKKQTLFFQVGDHEDEDDITIFVKDNLVVTCSHYVGCRDSWAVNYDYNVNYENGFNEKISSPVFYMEQLNK